MKNTKRRILSLVMAFGLILGVSSISAHAEWQKTGANWQYTNADGTLKTGWLQDGSNWYFFSPRGQMVTGWVTDNNTWYYMSEDGSLDNSKTTSIMPSDVSGAYNAIKAYTNSEILKYKGMGTINENISQKIVSTDKSLYDSILYIFYTEDDYGNSVSEYFYNQATGSIYKYNQGNLSLVGINTAMINTSRNSSNWKQTSQGTAYYKNGIKQAGWVQDNGKWYYFDTNGIMQIGWINDINASTWYYLNDDGSRDETKTKMSALEPSDIIQAESIFSRQTNDIYIKYTKTVKLNNKIFMLFQSTKDISAKYYYEIATQKAYCVKNGVIQEFGTTIGDIKAINAQYNYEQCEQMATDLFSKVYPYSQSSISIKSDTNVDANGQYHFAFYNNGTEIVTYSVNSLTGEIE